MIIDNTQKKVLFDDAAKLGLTRFEILSTPETFKRMLGSIEKKSFGLPLVNQYIAVSNESINIKKISEYFVGYGRDLKVGNQAASEVEQKILYIKNEFWVRSQNLKNKAKYLKATADLEGFKSGYNGTFVFGDSFTSAENIDLTNTSAWFDVSEGIVFLPNSVVSSSIDPKNIRVDSVDNDEGSDSLGSSPLDAVDGLENTSWKTMFVTANAESYAVYSFDKEYNISNIQIDPTGFGCEVKIEVNKGNGFELVNTEIIYKTTTFIVGHSNVRKLKITYKPASAVLPKTVGIRNIRLFTENTVDIATLRSRDINIPINYSQILLDFTSKIPAGTYIKSYISNDSGVTWTEIKKQAWKYLQLNQNNIVKIDKSKVRKEGSFWVVDVTNAPTTYTEGSLLVGKNQVEVTAFKKDYTALGELPHTPAENDFLSQDIKKFRTWLNVPTLNERTNTTQLFLPPTSSQNTSAIKGAEILPFEFQVTGDKYQNLCYLMLGGGKTKNVCQPNFTYKVSYFVYCENDFFVDQAKYSFLQGYRDRSFKSFTEVSKVYGGFTLDINKSTVITSNKPFTVYTTADTNGCFVEGGVNGIGNLGSSFNFTLRKGWNLIETYLHTLDPDLYGNDNGAGGFKPMLQFSMFPSFFDKKFQLDAGITKVVASGESKANSEFELMWNTPQDFNFWAWDTQGKAILFNAWDTVSVDGYIKGSNPNYELEYTSSPETLNSISSVKLRFDLIKEPLTFSGPILEDYKITVR
jgi:hypothetical protein